MIAFLEAYENPSAQTHDGLSKEEKQELKHLWSWYKNLKSKVKEEHKPEKS